MMTSLYDPHLAPKLLDARGIVQDMNRVKGSTNKRKKNPAGKCMFDVVYSRS